MCLVIFIFVFFILRELRPELMLSWFEEGPAGRPGGPGDPTMARVAPPGQFLLLWTFWPSSWSFLGLSGTPSNPVKMSSAFAKSNAASWEECRRS